jgi:DNA polymerase I-like protein with 3'-5' exonuclease and polymerase domains
MTAGWIKALAEGYTIERYMRNTGPWERGVSSGERYGAKPFNFGLLFGGGIQVVIDTARDDYGLTLTEKQATIGHDGYFELYPDLEAWHDSCWADVERGWVETELGRWRRLVNEDPPALHRKAINTPVQSVASDIALFCTAYTEELLREVFGDKVRQYVGGLNFFHDAILTWVRDDVALEVRAIVKEAWENPPLQERLGYELAVPLVADIDITPTWN